MKPVCN